METPREYYKVILVDDEADVRQSIVRKLDWNALGFEVAGEAGNGAEALELVERVQPDVVMTDIKMPFMDGLELCRRLKRMLPGIRVAIFSGFDEFEYAKEAISQQVEEYILKPIDAGELAAIFRRMRASLDAEIAERRDVERLRHYYEQSLPLLQRQLLTTLLEGRLETPDIVGQLAEYSLDLRAAGYCVAAVRYWRDDESGAAAGDRLLGISVERLFHDMLEGASRCHVLQTPGRLALLFLLDSGGAKEVTELLDRFFPIGRRMLGIRLSIGVGSARRAPEEIAQSYREALGALEYQLLIEAGQCIYIGDIEPGAAATAVLDTQTIDDLLLQIKVGSDETLQAAVDAMVDYLKRSCTGVQQYQIYLLELFTELLQLIRTYRMDPAEAGQDNLLPEGIAMRITDLDEFGRWLFRYCENLRGLARRERKDSVRLLIDRAIRLLEETYTDAELSLDSVCASLDVSAAYLSTMFKKETGKGFVSYLTDLRMEKALELLATTDCKTYQIAERIGYADPNYFSYVFKKKYGLSPSKYRTDRVNQDGTAAKVPV